MNTIANVIENSIPSITLEEFAHNLLMGEQDLERHLHKTRERILKEIAAVFENETALFLNGQEKASYPAFHKAVELCEELSSLGLNVEARECLDIMAARINEIYPELKPWLRMTITQFQNYSLPDFIGKPDKLPYDTRNVFIEDWNESKGIINVLWTWEENKNEPDLFTDSSIATTMLIDFAVNSGLFDDATFDSVDHDGNHKQVAVTRDIQNYVEHNIETVIKEYIKSGWEKVTM
jgi:hypothetical protein